MDQHPEGADRNPLGAGVVEPVATATQLTVHTPFAPEDDTTFAFVAQAQRSIRSLIYGLLGAASAAMPPGTPPQRGRAEARGGTPPCGPAVWARPRYRYRIQ